MPSAGSVELNSLGTCDSVAWYDRAKGIDLSDDGWRPLPAVAVASSPMSYTFSQFYSHSRKAIDCKAYVIAPSPQINSLGPEAESGVVYHHWRPDPMTFHRGLCNLIPPHVAPKSMKVVEYFPRL